MGIFTMKVITILFLILLTSCKTNDLNVSKQPPSNTNIKKKVEKSDVVDEDSDTDKVVETNLNPQQNFVIDYTIPEKGFKCIETIKKVSDIDIIPPLIEHDEQLTIEGKVSYEVWFKEEDLITHIEVTCHQFETRTRRGGKETVVDRIPADTVFIFSNRHPIMTDINEKPIPIRMQRLLKNLTIPKLFFTANEERQQKIRETDFESGVPVDMEVAKVFLTTKSAKVIFEGTQTDDDNSTAAIFSFTTEGKTGEVHTKNGFPTKLHMIEKESFPQGQLKVKITTKTNVSVVYNNDEL